MEDLLQEEGSEIGDKVEDLFQEVDKSIEVEGIKL